MEGKGLFDRVIDGMAVMAGVLLCGAVIIECVEICMRYFVRQPIVWSVEICEYILFSLAFLGAPWLLKRGGHVSVDILVERLGGKGRVFLVLLSSAMGVIVSALICWFSLVTAWECYQTGVVVTKTLTVPKAPFLLLIALGYLFLLGEFGRQFFRNIKAWGVKS
ncbi:MAG: TRAP transporter small permease [Deltaproteobacteria bacterium]|nr:TRAP transporter small permease [Deltaproteobacteria bacterium]